MKLKKLLAEIPLELYRGNKEIEISGLCTNSKIVAPGDLFIAKKGTSDDGAKYIEEAISSGAVAILTDMGNPFLKNVAQLIHPDIAKIEGKIAALFYGNPSHELLGIGITGTSGKTTTSYLIKHFLDAFQLKAGLIGTIEYILGETRHPAERTTPDVISNNKMLREMFKQGCKSFVMEVSSHGLEQGRVSEIDFDMAIFTNLSPEHLDYHVTMEQYAQSKALLFRSLSPSKTAIVNLESPWSKTMIAQCPARIFTYGFFPEAMAYAHEISLSPLGTHFQVTYQNETVPFFWKHVGRYNVLNCLAALCVMLQLGYPLAALPPIVKSFSSVPGRLERIGNSPVFVDYAHKPDALEKVLQCLQEIKKGKVITIFGCGGDRDRGKRPLMASIAEQFSDFTIVTSDNPRTENPLQICQEIIQGFKENRFCVEPDRRKAIAMGIEMAKKEDLILIAGKGHETYQIFAHQTIPFDDREVAAELIKMHS